jgi:aminoglycoside phosphotransferase family enzyme
MNNVEFEQKTDMDSWLQMVEQIRQSPDWSEDELPIEMKQTHISVLLLGRRRVMKLKSQSISDFSITPRRQNGWPPVSLKCG